jgi:hypothetical protein
MATATLRVGPLYGPLVAGVDQRIQGAGAHGATMIGVYAIVDMHSDGTEIRKFEMLEADYAGIVAEWTTGSLTAVFAASLATEIAADSHTEPINATQRTNLVNPPTSSGLGLGSITRLTSTDTATNYNSTGGPVAVSWDTQDYIYPASGGGLSWSAGADTRITCDIAGVYRLTCQLALTSASQYVSVQPSFRKNGATALRGIGAMGMIRNASGHNQSSIVLSVVEVLAATDYVEVVCEAEAAAGAVNLISGESLFTAERVTVAT